jgi:hypothetical protein
VGFSRRQLLGAGLGLTGVGLLGAPGAAASEGSSAFSLLQNVMGRRVPYSRTVSARFAENVRKGSLLVAVVSRLSTETLAPTIGTISDDHGNHWRQAVEYFTGHHYGVDIWYCESARGGARPTVTGVALGYPVHPGAYAMRMTLLEYSGAQGYQLCDQIGQTDITGPTVHATTAFAPASDDELAVSVIVGDMKSATVPDGWNRRMADPAQGCYMADTLSTGPRSGSPLSATWTGLTGASAGAAITATFVPRGVAASSRRLVQSAYTDSAIRPAGKGDFRWRSQPFPVDPAPGNTLVAFMNGSIYHPKIDCGSIVAVHDTAGGRWRKLGQSGPDDHTGINISAWICDAAVGGPTALTATFDNRSQQLACLLLEFANLPAGLRVSNVSSRNFGGDLPLLTTEVPLQQGDIALAFRTSIWVLPQGPGSADWKQVMSDTTGANAQVMLDTSPGPVTASWSGDVVGNGLDLLLVTLSP